MKFIVNTDDFKKALEKANKVTGVKTSEKLENVRVHKIGTDVHLLATNLNQFIDIVIESYNPGDVEFQFSDTKSILKAMKFFTGYEIEFDCGEHEVTMFCGGKKAKQRLLISDYPDFPVLEEEIYNEFEYDGRKLKERFNAVKYAVSTKEHKGVLTGVCFRNNDMVAIDGFRMAINRDKNLTVSKSFVVPAIALKNITDIMNETIKVTIDKKIMKVVDNSTTFITRLVDGKYVDYSHFIANSYSKPIIVDVNDFQNGLKYLKTFIAAKAKQGVYWCNNKLGLKNTNGYFEREISVTGEMNMEISFNVDYMLEALNQFNGKVEIQLSTNTEPMLISSEDDENNIALVHPIRSYESIFETAV